MSTTRPASRIESRSRPVPLVLAFQVVAIAAVLAGAGAIGGVLWEHWWTPPTGEVQQGAWAVFSEAGLRADFSGVALYVLVAAVAGLVGGVVTGLLLDRAELLSLVVLAAAAALGGWLMWKVGVHRSPPDPRGLAAGLADGTTLPGHLRLYSRVPFVSMPLGAVVGYALLLLAVPKRGVVGGPRRTDDQAPFAPSPRPGDGAVSAPSWDGAAASPQPPFGSVPPG